MTNTTTTKTGWEIQSIAAGTRSRFYVQGVNHETTDPLFRTFSWHVDSVSNDGRYWLAEGATVDARAEAALDHKGWPRRA